MGHLRPQTKRSLMFGAALFILVFSTLATRALLAQQPSVLPAATPEGAVAQTVELANAAYAGDCAGTISPDDLGKICSQFVAQQGSIRAYLAGRTFSEYTSWVFVEQVENGWVPAGTAPFDDTAPTLKIPWPKAEGGPVPSSTPSLDPTKLARNPLR